MVCGVRTGMGIGEVGRSPVVAGLHDAVEHGARVAARVRAGAGERSAARLERRAAQPPPPPPPLGGTPAHVTHPPHL